MTRSSVVSTSITLIVITRIIIQDIKSTNINTVMISGVDTTNGTMTTVLVGQDITVIGIINSDNGLFMR